MTARLRVMSSLFIGAPPLIQRKGRQNMGDYDKRQRFSVPTSQGGSK